MYRAKCRVQVLGFGAQGPGSRVQGSGHTLATNASVSLAARRHSRRRASTSPAAAAHRPRAAASVGSSDLLSSFGREVSGRKFVQDSGHISRDLDIG